MAVGQVVRTFGTGRVNPFSVTPKGLAAEVRRQMLEGLLQKRDGPPDGLPRAGPMPLDRAEVGGHNASATVIKGIGYAQLDGQWFDLGPVAAFPPPAPKQLTGNVAELKRQLDGGLLNPLPGPPPNVESYRSVPVGADEGIFHAASIVVVEGHPYAKLDGQWFDLANPRLPAAADANEVGTTAPPNLADPRERTTAEGNAQLTKRAANARLYDAG